MYVCTAKPVQCKCVSSKIIILCLKYVFSSNIINLAVCVCVSWQMCSLHCALYTLYRMCTECKPTLFKWTPFRFARQPPFQSSQALSGVSVCLSAGENQSALIWLCQCFWHKTCQLAGGCTIERFCPERQDL